MYSSFFLTDLRGCSGFFHFSKNFVRFSFQLYHGNQMIPGGESAFGDRPASSISEFSAAVNSDLGNGSFWPWQRLQLTPSTWLHNFTSWLYTMYVAPWHTNTSSFSTGLGSRVLLRRPIQTLHKTSEELSFMARCLLSFCDISTFDTFDGIFGC